MTGTTRSWGQGAIHGSLCVFFHVYSGENLRPSHVILDEVRAPCGCWCYLQWWRILYSQCWFSTLYYAVEAGVCVFLEQKHVRHACYLLEQQMGTEFAFGQPFDV